MEQLEELKQISNILKAQAIHISINGIITTEFQMQNVSSRFNKRSGILYLYDKETSNKLVVETNMAYRVITSEDKRIIKIKIDNEEDIRIEIKNKIGSAPTLYN